MKRLLGLVVLVVLAETGWTEALFPVVTSHVPPIEQVSDSASVGCTTEEAIELLSYWTPWSSKTSEEGFVAVQVDDVAVSLVRSASSAWLPSHLPTGGESMGISGYYVIHSGHLDEGELREMFIACIKPIIGQNTYPYVYVDSTSRELTEKEWEERMRSVDALKASVPKFTDGTWEGFFPVQNIDINRKIIQCSNCVLDGVSVLGFFLYYRSTALYRE